MSIGGEDHWLPIQEKTSLFRYVGEENRPPLVTMPVVMVHGVLSSHRTWNQMAEHFWNDGFEYIYATNVADLEDGLSVDDAVTPFAETVEWLLSNVHPQHSKLILVGHSIGGVVARRYVEYHGGFERVLFLFSLAGPHKGSLLSHLSRMAIFRSTFGDSGDEDGGRAVPTNFADRFVMVNIYGESDGAKFDGVVNAVDLPEAVNVGLKLSHTQLNKGDQAYNVIRQFLLGQKWVVRVLLRSMRMLVPNDSEDAGAFYFEIEGQRAPFDGVFQPRAGRLYEFTDLTPLGTFAYPMGARVAADIRFRLREVSRAGPVRRTLYAILHVPLVEQGVIEHTMQDNFGSEINLTIHCAGAPRVIPEDG